MNTKQIDVRRSSTRFHTEMDWLESFHTFSFGGHYDPKNVGHGLLIVSNDDVVAGGGGFGTHPHKDMEIVTWVLSGELEHRDSAGNTGVLYPGLAQRMSAGSGIRHSEVNHSATEPVHLVQMWILPDQTGIEPGYEQLDVNEQLASGGLVAVASGRGHPGAITLNQAGAVMYVARMGRGDTVTLPDAPYVHAFVASGQATLGPDVLDQGDAVRLTHAGAQALTASGNAEVIVWETTARD